MVIRDIDFDYFLGEAKGLGADVKGAASIHFRDPGDKSAGKFPCTWDAKESKWQPVEAGLQIELKEGADFDRVRMGRSRTQITLKDKGGKVLWTNQAKG